MEKKLNNSHFYICKDSMLVTLKQTIVAILMARLVELGVTRWTQIHVGSIVVFLHVKPKVGVFNCVKRSVCLFSSTVGCVYNFQIEEGYK